MENGGGHPIAIHWNMTQLDKFLYQLTQLPSWISDYFQVGLSKDDGRQSIDYR